jgi:hypothetical protein
MEKHLKFFLLRSLQDIIVLSGALKVSFKETRYDCVINKKMIKSLYKRSGWGKRANGV